MRTATCVIKREPFIDLKSVQEEFNRVFGSGIPNIFSGVEAVANKWTPRADVFEDEDAIVIEADLPGLKAEDFNLSVENFKLTLSGERKFEKDVKKEGNQGNWHRVERNYGSFSRTFTLPVTVNVEAVKAEFKDGVLYVTLPKREDVKARNINVTVKTETNGANGVAS